MFRIDRERQRLQHEVIELSATIDQVQKDKVKVVFLKICEVRLEGDPTIEC